MDIIRIGKDPKHFKYHYIKNNKENGEVSGVELLEQIKNLHIPPAWTDVHITSKLKAKVQAYGLDSKGRKQVIYAKWFTQQNKDSKYTKIMQLEPIIKRIKEDIHKTFLSIKNKTEIDNKLQISLILHIMMLCNFRIGNDIDTRGKLKAYGLTTLQWSHVRFSKESKTVYFEFVGKKGVINKAECNDPFVYNILRRMKNNRTTNSATTNIFAVSSSHVNTFLHEYDTNITSKDIRTWMANELYIKYFFENAEGEIKFDKRQRNALAHVATNLHNTPAVCKTSYIFPEFLEI